MTIDVKPLGDRVLVQPLDEKEVNKGGIIIPDTAKEKPQEGTVAAIGTGKLDDNGKKIEFTVKSATKSSSPNTGAPRPRSTATTISSCVRTTFSASLARYNGVIRR